MKSYTDIEQSKRLAEILPLETADMTLPFTRKENNEYIPGRVVSRNYIDVYNDMFLLLAMDKETISKLIQPCWSLSALLDVLPKIIRHETLFIETSAVLWHIGYISIITARADNLVNACVDLIIELHKLKML